MSHCSFKEEVPITYYLYLLQDDRLHNLAQITREAFDTECNDWEVSNTYIEYIPNQTYYIIYIIIY